MTISFIGLGKMGYNIAERLSKKNYRITAFDSNKKTLEKARGLGIIVADSILASIRSSKSPRLVWIMIPHQSVGGVLREIMPLLSSGDTVIDGGNSFYKESIRYSRAFTKRGIYFLDVGISGGPDGALNGACIMIGGRKEIFKKYENIFKDMAAPGAYGYMGNAGAGHFVKMVHNGIEYGMMQALAEGFTLLKKSNFGLNLRQIADIYNHRSVIESRLVGWLEQAYGKYGDNLKEISGQIAHTGEGLWTVETARRLGLDLPVIGAALKFRIDSEINPSYMGKIVSAIRGEFGGHDVKKYGEKECMILILMGVMGSGKSTIGKLLASALGWTFYEGDDFHPADNVDKMRSGIALNDKDRLLWLEKLRDKIQYCLWYKENTVITCSALKQEYRNILGVDQKNIKLIYLKGGYGLIRKRLEGRKHPYMNKNLLQSQFEILEEPEKALYIDISSAPEVIVKNIKKSLNLKR